MLEIRDLRSGYEPGIDVLRDVALTVAPSSIVSVVGANGAGKSTLLRTVSGVLAARRGSIIVDGKSFARDSPAHLVRAGVAHVPEGRQVFSNLTVYDNLVLGAYLVHDQDVVRQRIETVLEYFPALSERMKHYAGSLSGGQQQMLAIGRGMMAAPKYMLLDEPSLGLAPQVTQRIFEALRRLRSDGVGILLVEQNGRLALSVANTGLLLERGAVTLSGTGQELLQNSDVIERYLGVGSISAGDDDRHRALVASLRSALAR